jgi:hypothetical protein
MARNRPYKKDLTPLTKGGSIKTHVGKGAREQSRDSSGAESLTGDPMQGMANQYSKPAPEPEAAPLEPEEPPVPMGQAPSRAPTALMPPSAGGDDEAA